MAIKKHVGLDTDTTLGGNNAADDVIASQKAVKTYVDNNSAPYDNLSITRNGSSQLQTVGVIDQADTTTALKMWSGTKAEYDLLTPDSNTLYNITDDTTISTMSHNVGDIFFSLRTENVFNGAVVCDGSTYNIADYSEGAQSVKTLLDTGKLPYVSISNFDAMVTSKGNCRCFGYDGGSTFKVPKLDNVFVETGTASTPSEFIDAGLPNITGRLYTTSWPGRSDSDQATGALYKVAQGGTWVGQGAYGYDTSVGLNASLSSSIYGNSNTVQPNAVKYRAYIQLTTGVSDSALQNVSTLMNEALTTKDISNCITEIPQDIKLTLNSGTLTLKAGSKVYNGNGLLHTLTSDVSLVWNFTGTFLYAYCKTLNSIIVAAGGAQTVSSLPSPATTYKLFYNTTDGKCYYDDNSSQMQECSFPIAKCTANSGITSIDQTFNGFGYIGSTVFALPGVKVLIPNGRNDNGTLRNAERISTQVSTLTALSTYTGYYNVTFANTKVLYDFTNTIYYDPITNYNKNSPNTTLGLTFIGKVSLTNGVINSFKPYTSFSSLNWNDKGIISNWSMPSNIYSDLTFGASGSTYVAPANGYFMLLCYIPAGGICQLFNETSFVSHVAAAAPQDASLWLPVKSGAVVTLNYSGASLAQSYNFFRFYYAEGNHV